MESSNSKDKELPFLKPKKYVKNVSNVNNISKEITLNNRFHILNNENENSIEATTNACDNTKKQLELQINSNSRRFYGQICQCT